MFRPYWTVLAPAVAAAVLLSTTPTLLHAQDRPDERHNQDQRRDQPNADHRDNPRPAPREDDVARYRHDHPHAAARCHDGFFTTTADRGRACSKHGGIDVWLMP